MGEGYRSCRNEVDKSHLNYLRLLPPAIQLPRSPSGSLNALGLQLLMVLEFSDRRVTAVHTASYNILGLDSGYGYGLDSGYGRLWLWLWLWSSPTEL